MLIQNTLLQKKKKKRKEWLYWKYTTSKNANAGAY